MSEPAAAQAPAAKKPGDDARQCAKMISQHRHAETVAAMIFVGDKLGLLKAMADAGPLSADGAARGPFLGARALLTLTDLSSRSRLAAALVTESLALSASQAELAASIATGKSLEDVAADLEISWETARTHLKNVFAKTGTNRQGDLIALLSKL